MMSKAKYWPQSSGTFTTTNFPTADCRCIRKLCIFHYVHCRQPIRKTQPTKCAIFFLRYIQYNVTLNVPTSFDPQVSSSKNTNNGISYKTKLATYTNLTLCQRVKANM